MLAFSDAHGTHYGAKRVDIPDKIVIRYIANLFSDTVTERDMIRHLLFRDFKKVTNRGYRLDFI